MLINNSKLEYKVIKNILTLNISKYYVTFETWVSNFIYLFIRRL